MSDENGVLNKRIEDTKAAFAIKGLARNLVIAVDNYEYQEDQDIIRYFYEIEKIASEWLKNNS